MNIWIAADLHLEHRNCAGWRGFSTVEEHDETILDNLKSVIGPKDTTYFLGDVTCNSTRSIGRIKEIPGFKHLILGNHDHHDMRHYVRVFNRIKSSLHYKRRVILSHIPVHPYQVKFYKIPNIHGHLHNNHTLKGEDAVWYFNANIENHDLKPLKLLDVIEELEAKLASLKQTKS